MAFRGFGATGGSGFGFGQAAAPSSGFVSSQPSSGFGFGASSQNVAPSASPFGAAAVSPSPFGGANTTPAFGSAGTFGTSTPSTTSTFGNTSSGTQVGFGGFGSSTTTFGSAAATPASSPFGPATTTNSNLFGGGGGMFGSAASTAKPASFGAYGSTPATTNAFGANSTTSAFGAVAAPNAFGSSTTNSAFGTSSNSNPFGVAASQSAFGASAGSTASFGAATSAFGASTPAAGFGSSAFGTQSSAPSSFGALNPGSSPFGATPSSTSTFGTTGTSAFGGFGAAASNPAAPLVGTGNPSWKATLEQETEKNKPSTNVYFQSISKMTEYQHKSAEELRWEDYLKRTDPSAAQAQANLVPSQAAGAGGLFGQAQPMATSAFGAAKPPISATGFSTSNAFGAGSTSSFGSAFGTPSTTTASAFGGFGQAQPTTTNAFSAAVSQPAATTFSGFMQPATTTTSGFSGFGQQNASATTSGFGQTSSSQPATGGFGFGAAQPTGAANAFGTANKTGGFGFGSAPSTTAVPSTTTNAFGSTGFSFASAAPTANIGTTTNSFGAPAITGSSGFSFGSKPATTGAPSTGFTFGNNTSTASTNTFGSMTPSSTGFNFGGATSSTTPAAGSTGFSFGGPSAATSGTSAFSSNLFSKPSTTSLFGQSTQPLSTFGQSTTTTPNTGFLFGNPTASTTNNPLSQQQQQQPMVASYDANPYGAGSFGAGLIEQQIKTTLTLPLPSSLRAQSSKMEGTPVEYHRPASLKTALASTSGLTMPKVASKNQDIVVVHHSVPVHRLLDHTNKAVDFSFASTKFKSVATKQLTINSPHVLMKPIQININPSAFTKRSNHASSSLSSSAPHIIPPVPEPTMIVTLQFRLPSGAFADVQVEHHASVATLKSHIAALAGGAVRHLKRAGKVVANDAKMSTLVGEPLVVELEAPSSSSLSSSSMMNMHAAATVDAAVHSTSSFDDFCTAEEHLIKSTSSDGTNNAKQQNPVAPKLTKDGYYTIPPYASLCHLSTEELMAVDNFAVGCQGLGCVQWYGSMDVTNLNLDELIVFAMREVIVYPNEEAKHPVGSGLNRPALVELLNVFPPTQAPKRQQYIDRVQARTESMDATFVDYCPEGGVWKFRVEHFSRYGFEEEEQAGEKDENEQQRVMKNSVKRSSSSSRHPHHHHPPPPTPPPPHHEKGDDIDSHGDDDDEMSVLHAVVTQKSHVQPDRLRHWQRIYRMNIHGEPEKQQLPVGGKENSCFQYGSLATESISLSSIDQPQQQQQHHHQQQQQQAPPPPAFMKTLAHSTVSKPRAVVEEPILASRKHGSRRSAMLQVGYCF